MTSLDPKNKSNFTFNEYHGIEIVDYKSGETRGNFIHGRSYLTNISINISSISEIIATIIDITNYIRWKWRLTKGLGKKKIMEETLNKLLKSNVLLELKR